MMKKFEIVLLIVCLIAVLVLAMFKISDLESKVVTIDKDAVHLEVHEDTGETVVTTPDGFHVEIVEGQALLVQD